MAFKPPTGRCRLCGGLAPLSREHIPPAGSYGSGSPRTRVQSGEDYLAGRPGRVYQSGFLTPVLCEECNKKTGAWYGTEYAKFATWGHQLLDAMRKPAATKVPTYVGFPARIGKQVLSTMIAASQPELTQARPDLRELVLNRGTIATAGSIELALYLCPTSTGRSTGVAWAAKPGQAQHRLVEFALPPFGWVLTLDGHPLDPRPVDVSHFLGYGIDEELPLPLPTLPVLPTHEAFPGDYRTLIEIRRGVIVNILTAQHHPDPTTEASRIIAAGEGPAFFEAHGEEW